MHGKRSSSPDSDKLKVLIEADLHKNSGELGKELCMTYSIVLKHLKAIGKTKKLDKLVSQESKEKQINCRYEINWRCLYVTESTLF